MRKPPEIPPQNVTRQKQVGIITQVREYKLITPLFGGGVEKGEADPVTIIRGTEIRGQLRFWWRACRAGNYTTIKYLKEAEDKIWGAANKKPTENKNRDANEKKEGASSEEKQKGTVQIAVEQISEGTPDTPFEKNGKEKRNQRIAPVYGAFPLQPSDDDKRNKVFPKNVRQDVKFKLTISFHKDFQEEIKAALWAWETFGGIGARTRRGFGALQLLKIDNKDYTDLPVSNNVRSWIEKKLNDSQYVVKGTTPDGIAYLSSNLQFKVTRAFENSFDSWNNLIKRLSGFRQFPQGRDKRSKLWIVPEFCAIGT
jgi:CRISPR-associated protein Cmr1